MLDVAEIRSRSNGARGCARETDCVTALFDFIDYALEKLINFCTDIRRFDTLRNACSSLREYENGW